MSDLGCGAPTHSTVAPAQASADRGKLNQARKPGIDSGRSGRSGQERAVGPGDLTGTTPVKAVGTPVRGLLGRTFRPGQRRTLGCRRTGLCFKA